MRIEHVAMYVNDPEAARDFFVRFFGGRANSGYLNPRTQFRSYFISFDDGSRLELMTKPHMSDETKSPERTGYAHIAFSAGSKDAVDRLTEQLRAAGYAVISGTRITDDGYYESSIAAIEGNIIEITV